MRLWERVFGSQGSEHVVCFKIENYEEIYQRDEEVLTKLERNLAAAGAIPAKIDFPSKLCCVTITDQTVKPENIQQVLKALGFRVSIGLP